MKSSRLEFMMTVIGFGMSIMFIIFLFTRLLCLRLNLIASTTPPDSSSRPGFGMLERGINGMESVVVASFPTMKYNNQLLASTEDAICTVCLGEYQEKDLLRLLPSCGHAFHIDCIDLWLRKNSTCPVCRLSLRDTSDDKNILSPWLNTRLWSRYRSGTNDEPAYAILNRVQSRSPVNVQEQPRITLASEVDENRRDEHLVVEIASENPFCHVSGNGYGKQVLCSFQSNNVENECAQVSSQVPDQNLIDKELQA